MAMMDYGAIAFKNGKLISTDMFTPMMDMVGWEDTEKDLYHNYETGTDEPLKFSGNYFAYIGDRNCTLAFYKEQLVVVERYDEGPYHLAHEYFNCSKYKWSKWEMYTGTWEGRFPKITVTKRNGYYVCKWKYKGDKYKVYFGYGVDYDFYKKWRCVNYYRSPGHTLRNAKRWFKDKLYDWKYAR